ncbi:nuclear transport factor 2 family protein [Halorussus halophilus]|uniref:nuclear transport factor 2 family protein n=1 Tax=Halorussus halophilus TaxID=2650975 RepID=UPI0013010F78|nr:nuclear transport factor 2 family protein [Halorussus halophilus]
MARADLAAVRDYYDAVDAEDYDTVLSLFADDVTYERPGQSTLSGIEQFREFYLDTRSLTDGRHEIDQLLADGDTVAVRGQFIGKQDGEEVTFGFADFHQFDEDGRIVKRWTYTDRDEV